MSINIRAQCIFWAESIAIKLISPIASADNDQAEFAILLHGLARSNNSLNKMADELAQQGYKVVNQGYASTDHLTADTIKKALAQCGDEAYHF